MCVSLRPARFSKTKGFAGEKTIEGVLYHLCGYGNRVASGNGHGHGIHRPRPVRRGSRFGWNSPVTPSTDGGNAMLLHFPAVPGTMGKENVIDTASAPNFLTDMEKAILPPVSRGGLRRGGMLGKGLPDSVQIFEHDIYTVVLASRAEDIPAALEQVPAEKRPKLNEAIFSAYAKWYPGWTFALCCFNNADEAQAKPLLWKYRPARPEFLFFPGMDAHDGSVPDLNAEVDVDHAIIVSSDKMAEGAGSEVFYSDNASAALRDLLPAQVIGEVYNTRLQQGDFLFLVDEVRNGVFNMQRELPPMTPLKAPAAAKKPAVKKPAAKKPAAKKTSTRRSSRG